MSTEEKIVEITKRMGKPLEYTESIPDNKPVRINLSKLTKLAESIREGLDDYTLEDTTYANAGRRSF